MARTIKGLDRDIRKLRRIVFHPSDDAADRAYALLGRLLEQRRTVRAREPLPTDRAGHTWEDRQVLGRSGLCSADFM